MKVLVASGVICLGLTLITGASAAATPPIQVTVVGPIKLTIQQVHFYHDSIGTLYAYGQITNHGAKGAADVGVEVDLYSAHKQNVARGATLTISHNVLPAGATGVWITDLSNNPTSWAKVAIKTGEQISAPDFLAHNYTGFKVVSMKLGTDNPGYSEKISGRVINAGAQAGKVDEVIAALYNAHGDLVRVADQGLLYPYATNQIVNAGKSAPFVVNLNGYTAKPARVVLYIRAEKKPQPNGFEIG